MDKFNHSMFSAMTGTKAYAEFTTELTSSLFAQLDANLRGCSALLEATQSFRMSSWKAQQEQLAHDIKGAEGSLVKDLSNDKVLDMLGNVQGGFLLPRRELYVAANSNKVFVFVDLRSANFNALRLLNKDLVLNAKSWEELAKKLHLLLLLLIFFFHKVCQKQTDS